MKFFSGDDFRINPHLKYTPSYDVEVVDGQTIVYVDNVYKNPSRVVEYLNNCPIVSHKPQDPTRGNGRDFYDGRQSITEAYDPAWFDVHKTVASLLGVRNFHFDGACMFNMTMLNSSPRGHWFPHTDPDNINCIVYLNKDNDYGPGTSFYQSFKYHGKGEHYDPWVTAADESHCILDRYNCAVFFLGNIYHSMRLVGETFVGRPRFSEVHFLKLGQ